MIIVLLLSILGFLNAFYLYYQHKREMTSGKKMFCLIGGDCGAVVGSKYGKTFGVKNEKIGMAYYLLLGGYFLISIFAPDLINSSELGISVIKIITVIATLFSVYLLYVQTFILKTLCSWCLIAIAINILIFYFLTFSPNSLTNLSNLGSITILQ